MSKAVVAPDQVQEPVLIEKGFNVLNVGSMIILPKTIQIYQIKKRNSPSK